MFRLLGQVLFFLSPSRFRNQGPPPTAALAVETCGLEEEEERAGCGLTLTLPSAYGAVPEGGTATLRTSKGPPAIARALCASIIDTTAGSRYEPDFRFLFFGREG